MATSSSPEWARLTVPLPPSAPDTSSPIFPERPIRPLPKRRLRSRLSEGEANSIDRPLDASSSPSVFSSPGAPREGSLRSNQLGETYTTQRNPDFGRLTTPGAYESDDERDEDTYAGQRSSWSDNMMKYPRGSTASSVDGESFENTNNKKKRKIPLNHSSNFPADANDSDPGYAPASQSWQADGMPPGRNGVGGPMSSRSRNVRSGPKTGKQPLGTSVNGVNHGEVFEGNTVAGAKDPRLQYNAEQENRRAASAQSRQAGNQANDFTFTAPSESAKHLNQASRAGAIQHPPPAGPPRTSATHGTQTTPNGAAQRPAPANVPAGQGNPQAPPQPDPNDNRPTQGELLRRQAYDRKRDQRQQNLKKPLTRKGVTLCDFCLYEAIFMDKPRALLRSYELKELKKRQEQENRRRLLEKAKAKSRKTRKNGRGNAAKGHAQTNPNDNNGGNYPDPAYDGMGDPQSPGDDYYDDDEYAEAEPGEYDDEGYDEYPPPLEPGQAVSPPGGYENPLSPLPVR